MDRAGIFDMKWSRWSTGSAQLGLALSNGSIGLLTPIPEDRCLGPLHSLIIEAESIATCVAFNARVEGALATSTASGQLGLVQVCMIDIGRALHNKGRVFLKPIDAAHCR